MIKEVDQGGNGIDLESMYKLVDQKMWDPDTIEQLIEALKCFDDDEDGKIAVPEMRWAMTALGEEMDDKQVDDLIKKADKEGTGYVEILSFANMCFGIKEKKDPDEDAKKKDKKGKGKK